MGWAVEDKVFDTVQLLLASGMCLVLICVMMLADLLGSGEMSLMKLLEDAVGSVKCMVLYQSDFSQASWVLSFSFLWNAYLAADLLCGRALVSSLGNLEVYELPCVVAFLAAWSAASFPLIPWWAGTHLSWIVMCGCFLLIMLIALWKVLRR